MATTIDQMMRRREGRLRRGLAGGFLGRSGRTLSMV
jgi:hypothetical protein